MRVATIALWKPPVQRTQEFLAVCAEAKKIHEKLGAEVKVWASGFGGEAGSIGYVLEFDDLAKLAEFQSKVDSDVDWQALGAKFVADPPAELIQSSLVNEAQLPSGTTRLVPIAVGTRRFVVPWPVSVSSATLVDRCESWRIQGLQRAIGCGSLSPFCS